MEIDKPDYIYPDAELVDGRCPEHGTEPQLVAEENWFFRLSRYAGRLRDLERSLTEEKAFGWLLQQSTVVDA